MANKDIASLIVEQINNNNITVGFIEGNVDFASNITFYRLKYGNLNECIPQIAEDVVDYYWHLRYQHPELPDNCDDKQFLEWIEQKLRKDITYFNEDSSQNSSYLYISVAKDEEWEKHFEHIKRLQYSCINFEFVDLRK